MAEKYNEYAELVEKLKCYIGRLFSVNHIKDDEIKDYLSKSFPICRTIEIRQTGLYPSLVDHAASSA